MYEFGDEIIDNFQVWKLYIVTTPWMGQEILEKWKRGQTRCAVHSHEGVRTNAE